MAQQGKGGGGEEEVDAYRQQSESKTSAALKMHAEAKVAFRGAEFFAREGEREVEQAQRPNKETAQNPPSLEDTGSPVVFQGETGSAKDDGDDEGSTSGSSSGGGGGMWAPPVAEDVADYISFAEGGPSSSVEVTQKTQGAKPQDFTFETADGPKGQMTQSMNAAKATGQTGQTGQAAAPAAAKSGGGAPGAAGPGGGKTGGGGGGKSGPGSGPG